MLIAGEEWRAYEWVMKHGGIATDESYGSYLGAVRNLGLFFNSNLITDLNLIIQVFFPVQIKFISKFIHKKIRWNKIFHLESKINQSSKESNNQSNNNQSTNQSKDRIIN